MVTKTGRIQIQIQIQAELCAAFRYRPARRDDVVGGLSPELVGVLGGWVRHGIQSSRSSLNAF